MVIFFHIPVSSILYDNILDLSLIYWIFLLSLFLVYFQFSVFQRLHDVGWWPLVH